MAKTTKEATIMKTKAKAGESKEVEAIEDTKKAKEVEIAEAKGSIGEAATTSIEGASIQETITKVMAEFNMMVEAIKASLIPAIDPEKGLVSFLLFAFCTWAWPYFVRTSTNE